MSSKFLARPLAGLDAIYRFVGGVPSSVGRVDLTSPIVAVHDVSREAERGASLLFGLSHSLTTAGGAAQMYATVEVADLFSGLIGGISGNLGALGRRPDNTDVYLMAIYAVGGTGGFGDTNAQVIPPNNARFHNLIGSTMGRPVYWAGSTDAAYHSVSGGQSQLEYLNPTSSERNLRTGFGDRGFLPMQVETIQIRVVDTGVATTVTYGEVFAFMPANAVPPPFA